MGTIRDKSMWGIVAVIALSLFVMELYGQTEVKTESVKTSAAVVNEAGVKETEKPKAKARGNLIKKADFYLRNGEFVFGKVIEEDKNRIVVERLEGSKIVVSTYGKKEIDPRTLHTRGVREYKYYLDLAENFTARTWDFKDDTDDFIQAIRCYEKAKQILSEGLKDNGEKINQIDENLEKLQADRLVWEREVESRARLKSLEFDATIEVTLKELEENVSKIAMQLEENSAEMKDNYERLKNGILEITEDIGKELDALEDRIERNREMIRRNWHSSSYRWYRSRPGSDSNSN